jgi:hypothetical protein
VAFAVIISTLVIARHRRRGQVPAFLAHFPQADAVNCAENSDAEDAATYATAHHEADELATVS